MSTQASATACIMTGIALDPKHEAAWNGRGCMLLELGKYDEAIKSFDKTIELAPKWGVPLYNRADLHARRGDKANAIADLKLAIELQPSLKAEAVREVGFKNLHSDPDFKKLVTIAMNADVSGKWTAKAGADTITLVLQSIGTTLTGTINNTSMDGETPISNGKVNGDEVSFSVFRTINNAPVNVIWKGKISGDAIYFVREIEGREGSANKLTAQRVK